MASLPEITAEGLMFEQTSDPQPLADHTTGESPYLTNFCTTPLSPNQRPGHWEILLPPLIILSGIATGIVGTSVYVKIASKKLHRSLRYLNKRCISLSFEGGNQNKDGCRHPEAQSIHNNVTSSNKEPMRQSVTEHVLKGGRFYCPFDSEVLSTVESYYNNGRGLIGICIPAFCSLVLTASSMLLYQATLSCLWPVTGRPDINTAITCFLAPAGLVYALSFGFTFQQALEKHRAVLTKVTNELSLMDQLATMAGKMNLPSRRQEMAIYKAIKSEVVFLAMLIQKREANTFRNKAPRNISVHIWSLIDIVREAESHPEKQFNLNRILVDKMIVSVIKLNNICADKIGTLHSRIHPLKWIFLEVLGGLVLLGIMLIDASSPKMELTMCELTIFSVSMLCYVLADVDTPFNGFFRIDISVLPEVVTKLDRLYTEAAKGVVDKK